MSIVFVKPMFWTRLFDVYVFHRCVKFKFVNYMHYGHAHPVNMINII